MSLKSAIPIHVFEWEPRIGMAVALSDNFFIQHAAILKMYLSQRPPVPVGSRLVELQPYLLSFGCSLGECRRLKREVFDGLAGMDALWRINADQPYPLAAIEKNSVAIHDSLNIAPFAF